MRSKYEAMRGTSWKKRFKAQGKWVEQNKRSLCKGKEKTEKKSTQENDNITNKVS